MRGSFHKHHHGGTNWQDFTFLQFAEVVETVCIALGLHPANMRLANLEVGANIVPPLATAEVLRSIVMHRTTAPSQMRQGHGIEIRHAAYRFKIYDKARQYERPGHLLRFEVAARKMRTLQRFKVRTLADLLDPAKWEALKGYLLARFDELLIVEPGLHPAGLRPAAVELLANAGNAAYWAGLNKRRRSEKRKSLNGIYTRHAPHGLKATLRAFIAAKLEELNDGPTPDLCTDGDSMATTATPRTFAPTVIDPTDHPAKGQNRTFAPHALRGAKVRVQGTEGERGDEAGHCLTCGRGISHQVARSKYCSERRIGQDGKSCRNRGSNFTRTLRQLEERAPLLFDHTPYLRERLGPPHRRNNEARP
ncbi:MAG: hypothetical protein IPO60_10610 [Flavobacteriales bacterium]|nr:hypothetical protein [Flavobacteriales bacterium]